MKWLVLFLLFTPVFAAEQAAPTKMVVLEFGWSAVKNAKGYEVKLTPKKGGAPIVFRTEKSELSEKVPVGVYQIQVRSQEKSTGYFGPWSRSSEIDAVPKVVELVSPADKEVIPEEKNLVRHVVLQWKPVPGTSHYLLRFWDDDINKAQEVSLTQNQYALDLKAGQVYHWQVTLEDDNSVDYDAPNIFTFSILGKQLLSPAIDKNIAQPHVKSVKWAPTVDAETYSSKLSTHALDETDWKPVAEAKDLKTTEWTFPELKAGLYRIEVTAQAKNRVSSKPSVYEFAVKPPESTVTTSLGLAVQD